LPVPIVIARHRDVSLRAPLLDDQIARIAAGDDEPSTVRCPVQVRGSKHGDVGLPVAIVIAWHGNVSGCPPLPDDWRTRSAAGDDVPSAGGRPPDGNVRL